MNPPPNRRISSSIPEGMEKAPRETGRSEKGQKGTLSVAWAMSRASCTTMENRATRNPRRHGMARHAKSKAKENRECRREEKGMAEKGSSSPSVN